MKRPTFSTIGISILIVLNVFILSFMFFNKPGKHRFGKSDSFYSNDMPRFKSHKINHWQDSPNKGRDNSNHKNDLNLSEEQKKEMGKLRKEHHEKSKGTMEKLKDLKKNEMDLLKNGKLDDNKKEEFSSQYAMHQKELHLLKLTHLQAVNNILTPEQKEKFAEKNMERKGHKKGHKKFNRELK